MYMTVIIIIIIQHHRFLDYVLGTFSSSNISSETNFSLCLTLSHYNKIKFA